MIVSFMIRVLAGLFVRSLLNDGAQQQALGSLFVMVWLSIGTVAGFAAYDLSASTFEWLEDVELSGGVLRLMALELLVLWNVATYAGMRLQRKRWGPGSVVATFLPGLIASLVWGMVATAIVAGPDDGGRTVTAVLVMLLTAGYGLIGTLVGAFGYEYFRASASSQEQPV